jgi:acyl-CoA synthetase (AMP-forming)/AMP-acid ligase II
LNLDEVPGMVGRLTLPGIQLAKFDPEADEFLKDEKGRHIKCKEPGDIGMVLIKIEKNDFFASYKNEEKTRKKLLQNVFRKGDTYFISGDLVVLHDDNWLSFYDRTGDTFRWKGENVSTLEVESIINSHPAIDSSTVFGVSVPKTEGKAGMAAIKLEEGENLDIENFSNYISDSLPNYAIPIFIRLCKEFELTGSFKIIKNKMKNEGYEIENIGDPLYFWDQKEKRYIKYTEDLHEKVLNGEINI